MKADRNKIGIAIWDFIDNSGVTKPDKSCPDDPHIPLKLLVDKKTGKDAMWCRECGTFWPMEKIYPKPKSKLQDKLKHRKDNNEQKTFVKQFGPIRKRKGGLHG